jgi:hypothetical protein
MATYNLVQRQAFSKQALVKVDRGEKRKVGFLISNLVALIMSSQLPKESHQVRKVLSLWKMHLIGVLVQ